MEKSCTARSARNGRQQRKRKATRSRAMTCGTSRAQIGITRFSLQVGLYDRDGSHGELELYKARLVACGNEQVLGVDYNLTFVAVMNISTAKVVLALVETWGVPAKHGDIPNAYVRGSTPQHLLAGAKRYDRVGEHSAQDRCYSSRRSRLSCTGACTG